jgi:hypothetical protein
MNSTTSADDPKRKVIVVGYAKMPQGTAVRTLYETLTLGVEVLIVSHIVVKVWSTLVTDGGREWVERNLIGENLLEEPAPFVRAVERDYWSQAAPALVQAHRDLVRRYRRGLEQEGRMADLHHLVDTAAAA